MAQALLLNGVERRRVWPYPSGVTRLAESEVSAMLHS
jgi:hypothetical protein